MHKCKTREVNKINVLSWCEEHEKCLPTGPHGSCVSMLKLAVKEKKSHTESKTAPERKVSALYGCNAMQNSTRNGF